MTSTLIASFIAVFAALFPVINPLGGGPIFLNMVQGCSEPVKQRLARSVAINSFFMLLGSMLIGPQLLLFFGISLPALKLAGGLVVAAMGWKLLNQSNSSSNQANSSDSINDATAVGSGFYPLTMPMTIGPGSIATAISLAAGSKTSKGLELAAAMPSIIGALLGLLALSLSIYFIYKESSGLQRILGVDGTNVLMRLFSFILLAIGVQIFLGGLEGFALDLHKVFPAH